MPGYASEYTLHLSVIKAANEGGLVPTRGKLCKVAAATPLPEAGDGQSLDGSATGLSESPYFFTCPETSLVISNMLTCFLPLKTAFRFSSALIRVLFFASCKPFLRM